MIMIIELVRDAASVVQCHHNNCIFFIEATCYRLDSCPSCCLERLSALYKILLCDHNLQLFEYQQLVRQYGTGLWQGTIAQITQINKKILKRSQQSIHDLPEARSH